MAKKKDDTATIGKIAFIIGLLLAIIAGVIPSVAAFAYTALILVLLGVIVGFINIAKENVVKLLLGIIALMMVGEATLSVVPAITTQLVSILQYFLAFVGGAGFIVAIKAILEVSKK
jgi:hypothetical protein